MIELLVVLAIFGLVATLVVPSVGPMMKGSQLTYGSRMIVDQLSLARQTALSTNHRIEVRFYRYADPQARGEQSGDPSTGHFRAIQIYDVQDSRAFGKIYKLPTNVVIDCGSTLSSLLSPPASYSQPIPRYTDLQTSSIPHVGTKYHSVSFQFLPSGSLNLSLLDSTPWFLTLRNVNDPSPGSSAADAYTKPPANFVTIQIDATNGHIKTFRP